MQMMSEVICTGTTSVKLPLSSIFSLTMLRCPSGMYGGIGRLSKGFIQGEANPYGRGRSNDEWDEDDGRKYTQINQSFPPLALGLHVHYIPPPLSIVFSTP